MAIYKPKLKKATSTLDEVKFPSTVIDGLDKIAVRYVGDASTLKTPGVYSVSFERDGSLSYIKSSSYKDYDDVNSILIVGKSDDGDCFQMMFYDGKVYYRKAGESSDFPYYWSQGISLLEGGGSGGGTTYTFSSGTTNGAFTVETSDGSMQSVHIYGLGAAAYKNSVDTVSSTNTNLVTSKGVANAIAGFVSRYASNENISGIKNFTDTLQYGGKNVAIVTPYYQLDTPYKITSTSSGTTTVNLSSIIPDFTSGLTYQLYGQIFAYQTSTARAWLWSDIWGGDTSTTYYIYTLTSNSRCASTAFTIPAKQWIKVNKNAAVGEFALVIYGYRVIR